MSNVEKRIRETLKMLRENRSTHAPRVHNDRGHITVGSGGGRLKKGFRSSGAGHTLNLNLSETEVPANCEH